MDSSESITSHIVCPKCNASEDFTFSKSKVNTVDFLTTILFPIGRICEHQFNVYIDIHGDVRGYQAIDFIVPSFEESQLKFTSDNKITSKEIDMNLIEMNYSVNFLVYICRVIFFRKKSIILEKDNSLINQLKKLFDYLTEDSFNYDIRFISKEDYEPLRKFYKEYVVLDESKIVHNLPEFLSNRKQKMIKQSRIEHYLVNKYLALRSYEFALQVLRKEIHTIYLLASSIAMYSTEIKNEEKINISKIKEVLKAENKSSDYNPYIDYLIEISKNYFGAKLPHIFSTVIGSI